MVNNLKIDLNQAAAFYVLGHLSGQELVQIALHNLDSTPQNHSLGLLAGETEPQISEVGPLFEQCLAENQIAIPTMRDAGLVVAKFFAQKIVSGELAPYNGAREIWEKAYNCVDGLEQLGPFVYAASEIEELLDSSGQHSQQRTSFFEDAIREASQELLR